MVAVPRESGVFAPSLGLVAERRDWLGGYRVSVVVPAKNEAKNLPHVLPRMPEWVDEVLLVDGNSTDDTREVARRLLPSIQIVQQEGRGKGAALRSGFAAATGDIIVMLDADGSTDPAEIPAFVGPLLAGADFAKGSRFAQGGGTSDMSTVRRLGNWAFVKLVQACFGGRFTDLCYGYNAFWARTLPVLALDGDGFEIETIMNVRALQRLRVVEVPSFEADRIHGTSNLRTFPDGWRVVKAIGREVGRLYQRDWAALKARGRSGFDALVSPRLTTGIEAEQAIGE
jgi:glycosyltransferase involved in cell wall biosynthesis